MIVNSSCIISCTCPFPTLQTVACFLAAAVFCAAVSWAASCFSPWVQNMTMAIVFALGYLGIIFEESLAFNKSGVGAAHGRGAVGHQKYRRQGPHSPPANPHPASKPGSSAASQGGPGEVCPPAPPAKMMPAHSKN